MSLRTRPIGLGSPARFGVSGWHSTTMAGRCRSSPEAPAAFPEHVGVSRTRATAARIQPVTTWPISPATLSRSAPGATQPSGAQGRSIGRKDKGLAKGLAHQVEPGADSGSVRSARRSAGVRASATTTRPDEPNCPRHRGRRSPCQRAARQTPETTAYNCGDLQAAPLGRLQR